MLDAAKVLPVDCVILTLLSDAGLRREEFVDLRISNVSKRTLRFRGKRDKDRKFPMTDRLLMGIRSFWVDRDENERVIDLEHGAIYKKSVM